MITYTVRLPVLEPSCPKAVTKRTTPATRNCRPMMIATTRVVSSGQLITTIPATTVSRPKANGHSHDLPTPARTNSGSCVADPSGSVMVRLPRCR